MAWSFSSERESLQNGPEVPISWVSFNILRNGNICCTSEYERCLWVWELAGSWGIFQFSSFSSHSVAVGVLESAMSPQDLYSTDWKPMKLTFFLIAFIFIRIICAVSTCLPRAIPNQNWVRLSTSGCLPRNWSRWAISYTSRAHTTHVITYRQNAYLHNSRKFSISNSACTKL